MKLRSEDASAACVSPTAHRRTSLCVRRSDAVAAIDDSECVPPVDESHCRVFFWRTRKVTGWHRDTWRFLYRLRLEGLHWAVLEQDRLVLENMAPNARDREFLYRHDMGLGRVRALLRKKAQAQVEAEVGANAAAAAE